MKVLRYKRKDTQGIGILENGNIIPLYKFFAENNIEESVNSIIENCGYKKVVNQPLTMGIASIYTAEK